MADAGEWEVLFAAAAGQIMHAPAVEARAAEKPKKKRKRQPSNGTIGLDERCSTKVEWPSWLTLRESLRGSLKCQGWQPGDVCQQCQRPEAEHFVHVVGDASTARRLFEFLRNVRCTGLLLATEKMSDDVSLKNWYRQWKKKIAHLLPSDLSTMSETFQALGKRLRSLSKQPVGFEDAVRLIMAVDKAYYQLYYAMLTEEVGSNMPHPVVFFGLVASDLERTREAYDNFAKRLCEGLDSTAVGPLQERFGWNDNPEQEDVLTTIRYYRQVETFQLFHQSGWTNTSSVQDEMRASLSPALEPHETPAPRLLMEWRDSCRDFLCHLYAYATVSTVTMDHIVYSLAQNNLSNVLELGAGTGYLASRLEAAGLHVEAFDLQPTGPLGDEHNEYHGHTPPYTRIQSGTEKMLRKRSNLDQTALLLCYPPPESNFACRSLINFLEGGGRFLVFIGEFKGLTGSSDFEKALQQRMSCVERYACRCWGTDAGSVTMWKRSDAGSSLLMPCVSCNRRESTHRCRLLRYISYCSRACFDKDEQHRDAALRLAMINLGQFQLIFENPQHFARLKNC